MPVEHFMMDQDEIYQCVALMAFMGARMHGGMQVTEYDEKLPYDLPTETFDFHKGHKITFPDHGFAAYLFTAKRVNGMMPREENLGTFLRMVKLERNGDESNLGSKLWERTWVRGAFRQIVEEGLKKHILSKNEARVQRAFDALVRALVDSHGVSGISGITIVDNGETARLVYRSRDGLTTKDLRGSDKPMVDMLNKYRDKVFGKGQHEPIKYK